MHHPAYTLRIMQITFLIMIILLLWLDNNLTDL